MSFAALASLLVLSFSISGSFDSLNASPCLTRFFIEFGLRMRELKNNLTEAESYSYVQTNAFDLVWSSHGEIISFL